MSVAHIWEQKMRSSHNSYTCSVEYAIQTAPASITLELGLVNLCPPRTHFIALSALEPAQRQARDCMHKTCACHANGTHAQAQRHILCTSSNSPGFMRNTENAKVVRRLQRGGAVVFTQLYMHDTRLPQVFAHCHRCNNHHPKSRRIALCCTRESSDVTLRRHPTTALSRSRVLIVHSLVARRDAPRLSRSCPRSPELIVLFMLPNQGRASVFQCLHKRCVFHYFKFSNNTQLIYFWTIHTIINALIPTNYKRVIQKTTVCTEYKGIINPMNAFIRIDNMYQPPIINTFVPLFKHIKSCSNTAAQIWATNHCIMCLRVRYCYVVFYNIFIQVACVLPLGRAEDISGVCVRYAHEE